MTQTAPAAAPTFTADVLIIGGGLVGGVTACALAEDGFSVVMVELGQPEAALAGGFDGRASAIALSSRRLLDAVGIWQGLGAEASPMMEIRVADGRSRLFLHYDCQEVGGEPFGYMVENRHMRQAILGRLATLPAVRLLAPARVASLRRTRKGVFAVLGDGRTVAADLSIAADGRASATRDAAGIRVTGWGYDQTAIVCTVAHERPHGNVAHEHFLPAGPFAILPLTGNRSSIVWTERTPLAPRMMALDEAGFLAQLRHRFGDFLGEISLIGPRFSYPLSLQYAQRMTDRRLVLVGDAAHAMHPIAGQGFNMGIRDVGALAAAAAEGRQRGVGPGHPSVLTRYERWRWFDNMLMLGLTDGLDRLFSNDIPPIRIARDLGLAAVHRMPALKRLFMRHAMGIVGELPPLMRDDRAETA